MLIRKQVQLTTRQVSAVKREAARRGISEAAFIREAVERALGRAGKRSNIDRILAVAGRYNSGLGDVGAEHDRYLEEIYHRPASEASTGRFAEEPERRRSYRS